MRTAAETFTATAASAGAARRMVSATLAAWELGDLRDDVHSVVSELASNAALHARSPFTVTLVQDQDAECLRVEVTDRSPARPRARRRSEPDATTGRGLLMVETLSTEWGVQPEAEGGKTVWCHFSLPRGTGPWPESGSASALRSGEGSGGEGRAGVRVAAAEATTAPPRPVGGHGPTACLAPRRRAHRLRRHPLRPQRRYDVPAGTR